MTVRRCPAATTDDQPDPTDDALWAAATPKGSTLRIMVRESAKLAADAYTAGDEYRCAVLLHHGNHARFVRAAHLADEVAHARSRRIGRVRRCVDSLVCPRANDDDQQRKHRKHGQQRKHKDPAHGAALYVFPPRFVHEPPPIRVTRSVGMTFAANAS